MMGGHAVDDSIPTRVGEPHAPADPVDNEYEDDHEPERDVKYLGVHPRELWS